MTDYDADFQLSSFPYCSTERESKSCVTIVINVIQPTTTPAGEITSRASCRPFQNNLAFAASCRLAGDKIHPSALPPLGGHLRRSAWTMLPE
jgi:hypothetical protein